MSKIVAVRKDDKGVITEYKSDNGTVYDQSSIVAAVDNGEVEGLTAFTARDGRATVRSNRGQEDYSLDKLPAF